MDLIKEKHEFLENCDVDADGQLYCKKCKNLVRVDWHKNLAFYGVHIISRVGITSTEDVLHNMHV